MRRIASICLFSAVLLVSGCVSEFIPDINENPDLLVVEGLITDQPGPYEVKLSRTMKIGERIVINPVTSAFVVISDDEDNNYPLTEIMPGTYNTNVSFRGITGRKYQIHINTTTPDDEYRSYDSYPVELKAVPPIDSVYFEKVVIEEGARNNGMEEGARIFVDSHDPSGNCNFFRWDFVETWEFHIPWGVPDNICWITEKSGNISIKSTTSLSESKIYRYPVNTVNASSDRLKIKYSMLIKQYSLSQDEYYYWEKLRNVTEDIGSLYDLIPSSIQGNMVCREDPGEKVLGYFSVSAATSKRVFVKGQFSGLPNLYAGCITDTIYGGTPIWGLGELFWILETSSPFDPNPWVAVTNNKFCYDCTLRGTNVRPSFWE